MGSRASRTSKLNLNLKTMNSPKHKFLTNDIQFRYLAQTYKILGYLGVIFSAFTIFLFIRDLIRIDNQVNNDVKLALIALGALILAILALSIVFILFSRAIWTNKKWVTTYKGYLIGILCLPAFPIGTFVGWYTLRILSKYKNAT